MLHPQAGVEAQSKVTELVPVDTIDGEPKADQVMEAATPLEATSLNPPDHE